MIDPELTPTRLINPQGRAPVVIREPLGPMPGRGLKALWGMTRLIATVLGLMAMRRLTAKRFGVELRQAFERQGGAWLRAAHLLSLRIDIFPAVVCEQLAQLQEERFGFPGADARRILEDIA